MKKLYELEYIFKKTQNEYLYEVLYKEMKIRKLLKYGFNSIYDYDYGYLGYDIEDFKNGVGGYNLDTLVKITTDDLDNDGYTIIYIKKVEEEK